MRKPLMRIGLVHRIIDTSDPFPPTASLDQRDQDHAMVLLDGSPAKDNNAVPELAGKITTPLPNHTTSLKRAVASLASSREHGGSVI